MEHDAQRPQVGAVIEGAARGLLRAHVGEGAQHEASPGEFLAGDLGDPEVEDLEAAVTGEHEVGGLDVAVDDARSVGVGQAVGHLGGADDRLGDRQRPLGDHALERPAPVVGHHDEEPAVFRLLHSVDRADVDVVERGRCLGLALEASLEHRVSGETLGQELEGDGPARAAIVRPVHGSHPSAAELLQQLVPIPGTRLSDQCPRKVERRGDDALQPAGGVRSVRAREQLFDFAPQGEVSGDRDLQEPPAPREREVGALVEEDFDSLAARGIGGHGCSSFIKKYRRVASASP